jgi:A/G-specific adenine glycosylase
MNEISARLLKWYDFHCRELPWRATRNPYYIWISEIILQQTRVSQGYDYFLRFIERFPTVESLAVAPEDDVMRMWQGLGYYSRARNLHAAAKQIVAMGHFPDTYESISSLKGVGDYTAAAIASFAYDIPKAAVDGNVCRLWARMFGIDDAIDTALGKQVISAVAQSLLPLNDAAKYNQASMEFGALQCIPRNPNCDVCPLSDKCVAYAEGRVGVLPVKSHKVKVTPRFLSYLYIHNEEMLLLRKRTAKDIWRNLYELVLIESADEMSEDAFLATPEFAAWQTRVGDNVYKGCVRGVKHVLSHRILHTSFYELEVHGKLVCPDGYVCIPFADLDHYALPRLIDKYLKNEKSPL